MANQNQDNSAYMNFIETLNEILKSEEISKLNYS